uniref:CSON012536 protein n=1 Tax=Culicoides sonorensis TaxID=179676 RepID=A0A336JW08_CULSO
METFLTILLLVALIILLIFIMCHILGLKSKSWFRTAAEEKIGLQNHNLFNANGYLMQSNSEILLGNHGSFKRFDSVDRDASQQYGNNNKPVSSPLWTSVTSPPKEIYAVAIPPQPTRVPPKPPAQFSSGTKSFEEKILLKQHSLNSNMPPTPPPSAPLTNTKMNTVIPRPVPKKQMSAPTSHTIIPPLTPPVSATNVKRAPIQKQCTNPFLEETIELDLININDAVSSSDSNKSSVKNPFIDDHEEIFSFDPKKIQNMIEDTQDPLKACEARITKLESIRKLSANFQHHHDLDDFSKTIVDNSQVSLSDNITTTLKPTITSNNVSTTLERYKTKTELLNHIKEMSSNLDNTIEGLTNNLKILDARSSENLSSSHQFPLRNRSMSETRVEEISNVLSNQDHSSETDLNNTNNNPFFIGSQNTKSDSEEISVHDESLMLHKTPSEMYLEQYSTSTSSSGLTRSGKNYNLVQQTEMNGHLSFVRSLENTKALIKQNSYGKQGNGLMHTSTSSGSNSCDTNSMSSLKRATSCDSVSSESSVVLGDLEQIRPPVTGSLCIGLQFDKNNATEEGCELFLYVLEAKDLTSSEPTEAMDTFVRIYLVPDEKSNNGPLQTKVFKNSRCPSYQETFSFWINKTTNRQIKRSLWFHLYHKSSRAHTLIGEAELKLTETSRPITTWLQLTDSRHNHYNWGELMFSLSYLPTAERLTIVVVKARNIRIPSTDKVSVVPELQNVFVKVYLLKNDRKVCKKKTTIKRGERCPIYNEAMIFSVPPYMLSQVQVRLTVVNAMDGPDGRSNAVITPIGHVIVGSGTSGKGLRHWHQMLTTSLRKPVAMWHALRITHRNDKKHYSNNSLKG